METRRESKARDSPRKAADEASSPRTGRGGPRPTVEHPVPGGPLGSFAVVHVAAASRGDLHVCLTPPWVLIPGWSPTLVSSLASACRASGFRAAQSAPRLV